MKYSLILSWQAFRHVKFAGLPSLPSRATSSNLSSRQSYRNQEDSHMMGSSRPSVSRRSSLASDSAVSSEDAVGASGPGYGPEMNEEQQSMDYLMASVLPTWDQVLRTLQKVCLTVCLDLNAFVIFSCNAECLINVILHRKKVAKVHHHTILLSLDYFTGRIKI